MSHVEVRRQAKIVEGGATVDSIVRSTVLVTTLEHARPSDAGNASGVQRIESGVERIASPVERVESEGTEIRVSTRPAG